MTSSKTIEDFLEYFQEIGITELSAAKVRVRKAASQTSPENAESPGGRSLELGQVEQSPSIAEQKFVLPAQSLSLFGSGADSEKSTTLEEIRADLGDCHRCKLAPLRTNIVFGSGNPRAALMFIGEAPGADEDAQGLPFVGRAGQLLTKIIEAIQLRREDVYICNVIKCRPPENRTPERDEIEACEPFLLRQIHSVQPKVIVCLGSPAMQTLLKVKTGITQLRGQWVDFNGIKVMATFHPAYCLRWPDKKKEVWEDMKKVREYLRFIGAWKPEGGTAR